MKTRTLRSCLWAGLIPVAAGLGWVSPALAGGIAPDLARQIQNNPTTGKAIRVIVQFAAPGVPAKALANAAGGRLIASHGLINGATLLLPQCAVAGLSHNPRVAWISPDRPLGSHWD